ncbi:MarR family transcriptional regulator [Rhizobium mesoamericanum]|uniref:MarR family winged helix-turn-helix transcriptional regulator n=1 Tax=Rhizobium mesoamericanum TaxID=1079800 RepID=UPI0004920878
MAINIDLDSRLLINKSCFGLNIQRAARVVARKFDDAFKPLGVNHWQFSLLMTLQVPDGMSVGELARSLVVDRTTITANVKPLERASLLTVRVDDEDARAKRIELTEKGRELLKRAFPIWQKVNAEVQNIVGATAGEDLLGGLASITNA